MVILISAATNFRAKYLLNEDIISICWRTLFALLKCVKLLYKPYNSMVGSPGLVVMGGDSWSECHLFESQHRILDGHFSHIFVVKIVMFVWKDENKRKRGWGWTIFLKKHVTQICLIIIFLNHSMTNCSQWRRSKVGIRYPHVCLMSQ